METSHAPTRVSTGTEGLDEVLHGGLIAGRLYLIEGDPGAGKTTLALRYLLEGLERGERGLYVTLSESADELRAGAASHGWSLDGIDIVELESGLEVQSELTMFHPSEIELGETTQRVLQAVERVQPHRMVLDSLSELRLLAQSSLRYRRQILALKQYFSGQNCTVVLLDDCTAEGPDMQLQSIAHGVISLKQTSPLYGAAVRQLRVIKFRGSDFISGSQDLAITRGGLQVYPRLTAAEHGTAFEPETVPSGVVALDQLLGGGIDRGTSTLVIGPAGAGKSTVAMRYAIAAAERGAHAAVFAFEESRALLLRRLSGLGFPLNEGVGPGQLMVRQIDATQVLPSQFSSMVRTSVERDGARVIVIDSLNGYLNAMPEERALTIQLHELLSYLNNHGVATFLVAAQVGMLGASGRGPVDASYLADAVVMLRLYEHQGMLKRAISVTKKRSGAHEETIRQLWFNSAGVHLGPPLKHLRGVLSGVPVELAADAFVTTQTDLAHGG